MLKPRFRGFFISIHAAPLAAKQTHSYIGTQVIVAAAPPAFPSLHDPMW